jgi:hypothetical protein
MNPLANHAACDVEELHARAERHSAVIAENQSLLRSFLKATPLSLRRK